MKQIPFGKPLIDQEEKNEVSQVLDQDILVHGPQSSLFEKRFKAFTKASAALSVSSCTAGLHLYYFQLGLGPGDEVLVPAQTHVATAHAVELVGATPVFVDAEIETGNMDLNKLESSIGPKTRAIGLVHYLGMPMAMDKVMSLAKKHKLNVLEDCALSLGATYQGRHTGLWGDAGCFSFYPVKHMTTAEGGMIISQHQELIDCLKLKRAFGVDRNMGERKRPGQYDVKCLGLNYRMSEVHAAMGVHQIEKVPSFLKKREENFQKLYQSFEQIDGIKLLRSSHGDFKSSYYCLSILLGDALEESRDEIVQLLKEKGIGTSLYYPGPVPYFSYYQERYGHKKGDFPVAEKISRSTIAFPVGPHLSLEDMNYIGECFKTILEGLQK